MLEYETLRLIWWVLLGGLFIGFAVMDGFDLGIAAILTLVARDDDERRVVVNTIGPVWEGNQVWLVLAAGAVFAAWPALYATAFSGLYLAMLFVLLALILRPVAFKYRSKLARPVWRQGWDWALVASGVIPTMVLGIAYANTLLGVPFHFTRDLLPVYEGSLLGLLNPFAVCAGIFALALLVMHGATFLVVKTRVEIQQRARNIGIVAALLAALLFVGLGVWTSTLPGYIASDLTHDAPSNPLAKTVVRGVGAWFDNYENIPLSILAPVIALLGMLTTAALIKLGRAKSAFTCSSFTVAAAIATPGLAMFPFILPSSTHPDSSLTVWDASSSQLTLFLMLIATAVFMPLIIAYTTWVYRVMRGPVTIEDVRSADHAY